jgi:hypothetical protein
LFAFPLRVTPEMEASVTDGVSPLDEMVALLD